MKIVIAPNSFKGSLSSVEAAQAIENGMKRVLPEAEFIKVPLSDGGDGLLEAVLGARGGERVRVEVTGTLSSECRGRFRCHR
jgi:glycerate kinase